jgi:hypothetical protein
MMTEGVLGQHMKGVSNKLKKTQRDVVREALFDGLLAKQLLGLPDKLDADNQFNISADVVEKAQNQLGDSRYGLRLF